MRRLRHLRLINLSKSTYLDGWGRTWTHAHWLQGPWSIGIKYCILKSKDILLPTKVHLVKALVFPVVMYECQSWTIKKAEHQRVDAFELWWRRLLRVAWTARRSNQSIIKEISPEYSLEGLILKLKLQYFGHLIQRADSLEKTLMLGKIESKRKKGRQRMRCFDSITDSMDMSLSKLWEILKDREAWHATAHGVSKSWTQLSYCRKTTLESKSKCCVTVSPEQWKESSWLTPHFLFCTFWWAVVPELWVLCTLNIWRRHWWPPCWPTWHLFPRQIHAWWWRGPCGEQSGEASWGIWLSRPGSQDPGRADHGDVRVAAT